MSYQYDSTRALHLRPAAVTVAALVIVMLAAFALFHSHLFFPSASVSAKDGEISDNQNVSVFNNSTPAVRNLKPNLLTALRRAATDAEAGGTTFRVNSGWRSPAYQNQLLTDAIAKDGSLQAAQRWVATPETSAHVSGNAVDIGPLRASDWLASHGHTYGLCQIYANEVWHYEFRPTAERDGCPPMYADPTQDPRMQHPADS